MRRSPITTHILDTSRGVPARGVGVSLEKIDDQGAFHVLATGVTDGDGRVTALLDPETALESGTYRIHFDTGSYFAGNGVEAFYPGVSVTFLVRATDQHYHVPLLLNPFGFSTYRGS